MDMYINPHYFRSSPIPCVGVEWECDRSILTFNHNQIHTEWSPSELLLFSFVTSSSLFHQESQPCSSSERFEPFLRIFGVAPGLLEPGFSSSNSADL